MWMFVGALEAIVFVVVPRRGPDDEDLVDVGDAVLIAGGPEATFDEDAWRAFLESIR